MHIVRYGMVVCLLLIASGETGHASENTGGIILLPNVGYGYAASKDGKRGMGYHAGARILANASASKRWGLEISYVSPFGYEESLKHENYVAAGIVLEAVLREQVVASIGTIGYIGVDQNKNKPFGVISGIGWEPKIGADAQLSVALRLESIFDTSTISRYSLSVGLKF